MEYLMTYGWAILIIAVVLGALFQLGVFNSSSFSPRAPPGACQVSRPNGPGTTTNINLMGACTGLLPQYVAKFDGRGTTYVKTGTLPAYTQLTILGWVRVYKGASAIYGGLAGPLECSPIWGTPPGATFSANWDACLCPGSGGCVGYAVITLPTNQWLMLAYTTDGAGHVNAYGFTPSQTYTTSTTGTAFTIPSTYWLLGQYEGPNWDSGLNGTLANIQAYSSVLTANELQAIYVEGIGGAPLVLQSLIAWWPLNGDTNDYSGNNYNGAANSIVFTNQLGPYPK